MTVQRGLPALALLLLLGGLAVTSPARALAQQAHPSTCIEGTASLPSQLEDFRYFNGYQSREARLCFSWDGGPVTGSFRVAGGWSKDGCFIDATAAGSFQGTVKPTWDTSGARLVGAALSGNLSDGLVGIAFDGKCSSGVTREILTQGKGATGSLAGAPWTGVTVGPVITAQLTGGLPVMFVFPITDGRVIASLLGVPGVFAPFIGRVVENAGPQASQALADRVAGSGGKNNNGTIAQPIADAALTAQGNPAPPDPAAAALAGTVAAVVLAASAPFVAGAFAGAAAGSAATGLPLPETPLPAEPAQPERSRPEPDQPETPQPEQVTTPSSDEGAGITSTDMEQGSADVGLLGVGGTVPPSGSKPRVEPAVGDATQNEGATSTRPTPDSTRQTEQPSPQVESTLRTPSTIPSAFGSLQQPGTTVLDPASLGVTSTDGNVALSHEVTDLVPQDQRRFLSLVDGAQLTGEHGTVTVSKYGVNAITLQPRIRPDGTVDLHPVQSEGITDMLLDALPGGLKSMVDGLKESAAGAVTPLENAINSRLQGAHLRVRSITIENGKLTIVSEPATTSEVGGTR